MGGQVREGSDSNDGGQATSTAVAAHAFPLAKAPVSSEMRGTSSPFILLFSLQYDLIIENVLFCVSVFIFYPYGEINLIYLIF